MSRVRGTPGRTPCPKGGGQRRLPHFQGQGQRPRVPGGDSTGVWPRGATPSWRSGAAAERSYPMPEVRGGGREELPHVRGKEQSCALLEQL